MANVSNGPTVKTIKISKIIKEYEFVVGVIKRILPKYQSITEEEFAIIVETYNKNTTKLVYISGLKICFDKTLFNGFRVTNVNNTTTKHSIVWYFSEQIIKVLKEKFPEKIIKSENHDEEFELKPEP